ncbi:MAG: D-2-hydroxyacid dehydrogenase [Oscillospiraceae bacterium]|nr:D-2-hydroxyacid dehydrogenase [Oscillospiraceae bacterium]
MAKKLTVVFPSLTEAQRGSILSAAREAGYECVFAADPELDAADAEIIFGYGADYLHRAKALRWFCSFSAGVEGYLRPGYFASPDVIVSNSSGAYGVTIAEHIVMAALELMRRQAEYSEIVARREWVRDLSIRSLRGARITLLGTGDIGREAAKRLRAFDPARIVGVNRRGADSYGLFDSVLPVSELEKALPETDLLIMSLPETAETRGILSAGRLELMPRGSFIVNVGRGSAIDQPALEALLRRGHFSGAALDVFAEEPIPRGSSLWSCPKLLITPHISGNVTLDYTQERIVELFLEDFENYCAGKPLKRLVRREIGY